MSLTYSVPAAGIELDQLLAPFVARIACEEADRIGEPAELRGPMQEGVFFHVFVPLVSTRSVEVGFEAATFSAAAKLGASDDDHALAQELAAHAARLAASSIHVNGDVFTYGELEAFHTAYGPARIREHIRWEVRALAAMLRGDAEQVHLAGPCPPAAPDAIRIMKIDGPVRTFHFGPRMLAEMMSRDEPDRDLWLISRIYATQWPELDHIAPPILESETPAFNAVQWQPEARHLLPHCDYLILADGELDDNALDSSVMIRASHLPDLVGDNAVWLDERNLLVEKIPYADWDALIARARAFDENPFRRAGA